jgi:hypothetical protein
MLWFHSEQKQLAENLPRRKVNALSLMASWA